MNIIAMHLNVERGHFDQSQCAGANEIVIDAWLGVGRRSQFEKPVSPDAPAHIEMRDRRLGLTQSAGNRLAHL